MIIVIANNQTIQDITLNTLSIVDRVIPGSGQVNLSDTNNVFEIIANSELEALVNADEILLTVNGIVLDKAKSLKFLNLDLGAAIATSLSGNISLDGIIGPIDYNTHQDNFNPIGLAEGNYMWINPTTPNKWITGIQAPAPGVNQILFVLNVNNTMKTTLKTNNGNSNAANRFLFKADIALEGNEGAMLVYCHVNQRWKCVATNR